MRRFLGNIVVLGLLGLIAFVYRDQLLLGWGELYTRLLPCTRPIAYSIGTFDTKFGLTQADFLKAIAQAESMWETPVGKELFAYEPKGKLKLNLVYDYRQETTERLQDIGLSVENSRASYEALTARYDSLKQKLETKKAAYTALTDDIDARTSAYNAEVASWNGKKGAPKDVYDRLSTEAAALKRDVARARTMEAELREMVSDINALAAAVNQVAGGINANAEEYNRVGQARGEEFTEGLFTLDRSGQRIDIYEFTSQDKLVRVLAHELGHALRLEHVEDPEGVMYRLNQGTNMKLTEDDIAALKKQCKIEG